MAIIHCLTGKPRLSLVFVFLWMTGLALNAQLQYGGKPLSNLHDNKGLEIEYLDIKIPLHAKTFSTGENYTKILKFAEGIETSYTPFNSGKWDTIGKYRVWQLAVSSSGAYSLNAICNPYQLAKGVKLFVSDKSGKYILGAFTDKNNKASKILPLSPLPGDMLIFELQVPLDMDLFGELMISKVSHDYVDIFNFKDGGFKQSGSCHHDINCVENELQQQVKRSVCRIIINGEDACTGTLLNSSRQDSTPYVITANHCIETFSEAENSIFLFDYESQYCQGTDGFNNKAISGSQLIASKINLDFSLVELSEKPPFFFKPYYAGWDASTLPADTSFVIHHPQGDVKKISTNADTIESASFSFLLSNSTWKVESWETGSTEEGSSGSSLFNKKGQVVGNLSGGAATCAFPYRDYFIKFSYAFDYFTDSVNRLQPWLDNAGLGLTSMPGMDLISSFTDSCGYIYAFDTALSLSINKPTGLEGYVSGINGNEQKMIAEKVINNGSLSFISVVFQFDKAYISDTSKVKIIVWEGEETPLVRAAEKAFGKNHFAEGLPLIFQFDEMVQVQGNFFVGVELNGYPGDTLAIAQTNQSLSVNQPFFIFHDGHWVYADELYQTEGNLAIGVEACQQLIANPGYQRVDFFHYIIPTFVNNQISLTFDDFIRRDIKIDVVDLAGKVVKVHYSPGFIREEVIYVDDVPPGFHAVRVFVDGKFVRAHKVYINHNMQ